MERSATMEGEIKAVGLEEHDMYERPPSPCLAVSAGVGASERRCMLRFCLCVTCRIQVKCCRTGDDVALREG